MTLVPTLLSDTSQRPDTGPLAKVAIVGRGFTGIMTAIALLKWFERPFHLVMFDPEPKIDGGEGVSPSATTLLNSRVRDLSLGFSRCRATGSRTGSGTTTRFTWPAIFKAAFRRFWASTFIRRPGWARG
jgi:hypothetical protein